MTLDIPAGADEVKPEEKTEIILFDWLTKNGKYVKEIYFNRKNKLTPLKFQTRGVNKKPDFIINLSGEYLAIEIKNEKSSKNILDAGKILDIYYKNYIEGKTKYFINNSEIKIEGFAVASGNSKKGYLFSEEKLIIAKDSKNKSKRYAASIGIIPKIEGEKSHQFVRELWSRKNRIEFNSIKPSLGIIISKGIIPMFQNVKYLNGRWRQRFEEL